MNRADIQKWFEDLVACSGQIRSTQDDFQVCYDVPAAMEWLAEAGSALAAVFGEQHPSRKSWTQLMEPESLKFAHLTFPRYVGLFKGAANQVRDGRIGSLIDGIRAETLSELLDQAEALATKGHTIAAAVIAGGTLETHLRRLCDRNAIDFKGDGSIGAYNDAIGQARNQGKGEVYGVGDSKQVTAWGDLRNSAAHKPAEFAKSREEVSLMIQWVRHFLDRVP